MALEKKGCSAVFKCPDGYYCKDAFTECKSAKLPGETCLAGKHTQCKGESKCIVSAVGGAKCSAGKDGINASTGESGNNPGHFMALDVNGCSAVFKCPPGYKCPPLGGKCKFQAVKRTCIIGDISHPINKVSTCKDTIDANCPSGYTDAKNITKPGQCYKYEIKDCVKNDNGNCVKIPKKPCPWSGYTLHQGSCRKKIFKDKICNSGYKRDGSKCKYNKEAECKNKYIKYGKHYCCPENTNKFDNVTKLCTIERKL